jgi:hypothetical protein
VRRKTQEESIPAPDRKKTTGTKPDGTATRDTGPNNTTGHEGEQNLKEVQSGHQGWTKKKLLELSELSRLPARRGFEPRLF